MELRTEFKYRVRLAYDTVPGTVFVFNLQPCHTRHQHPFDERLRIQGGRIVMVDADPYTATRLLHVLAESPQLVAESRAYVSLSALAVDAPAAPPEPPMPWQPTVPVSREAFHALLPSRHCHADALRPFVRRAFARHAQPWQRVLAIVQWVRWRMSLPPAEPGQETFRRDCAHLMITLCRASDLPARYATGVDYGDSVSPPGIHPYVEVLVSGRWLAFDPTGACIRPGLIRLATGRDAADAMSSAIFGSARLRSREVSLFALNRTQASMRVIDGQFPAWSTAAEGELAAVARARDDVMSMTKAQTQATRGAAAALARGATFARRGIPSQEAGDLVRAPPPADGHSPRH